MHVAQQEKSSELDENNRYCQRSLPIISVPQYVVLRNKEIATLGHGLVVGNDV
jgi:hypothetical protein